MTGTGEHIQGSNVAEAKRFVDHFDPFGEAMQADTCSVYRGMHSERGCAALPVAFTPGSAGPSARGGAR